MLRRQFRSDEDLEIRFPPFHDKVNNTVVEAGDTASVTLKKPDNTTQVVALTRDADTKVWKTTVAVASYQQGEWLARATSTAPDTDPQYAVLWWGVGLAEDVKGVETTLGTPVTDVSGDIALMRAVVNSIFDTIGTPEGVTMSADILYLRKLVRNRWKIDEATNQLTIYDDDGTTPLKVFDLKDASGVPTTGPAGGVRERAPV